MKTYLALGDSYTIGEQVLITKSFPYQTVQMLRNKKINIAAAEIVAKTGFTTDELLAEMEQHTFLEKYDFVSLLIGVNNQYRERLVNEFEKQFEILLRKAILFAGGNVKNVFVLSIPNWGLTPFAAERDTKKITEDIKEYNDVCKKIAVKYNANFIDVINITINIISAEMLAVDGLHPSAKEYKRWATELSNAIMATHFS